MAKYLRVIDHHFTDGDGRPDQELLAVQLAAPETWHLSWMYEHYATPLQTNGVAKVNIHFTSAELDREPSEVLGIATVYERFDAAHFGSLPPINRQRFFLDRFHSAMLHCADYFGWNASSLEAAYKRMIDESFQFSFFWKRPLANPERQIKVQAFVEASSFPTHLYLVFFNREKRELRRVLISVGVDGPGALEFALGEIRWVDATTVRVVHTRTEETIGSVPWMGSLNFIIRVLKAVTPMASMISAECTTRDNGSCATKSMG